MSITWKETRPAPKLSITYNQKLEGDPSLTVIGQRVDFVGDASTPPHRHGGASVLVYVISGEVLSGMNDDEAKVYKAGESWYEAPGCFHRNADNASKTEPAVILATVIIQTKVIEEHGLDVIFQIDPKYQEGAQRQFASAS